MASTSATTQRVDPFLTFNFQVKWNNAYVAAVSKVSGLTKTTEAVTFRSGGQPQTTYRIPGQTEYGPITLERGITFDPTFLQWANMMWYYPNTSAFGNEVALGSFRQNMQIELYGDSERIRPPIPTRRRPPFRREGGHPFRDEGGHRSDVKAATF